jgi:5-methylthioadenosine/S-adenosylhomocysteine deaminase
MKLAVGGVLPLREFLANNVIVSLGTDGAASNNSLNMFEVMKFCALIHKHSTLDPSLTSAKLVLDFGTVNGALATNKINSLGKIVEDAPADIIVLNSFAPNMHPLSENNLISHIVYACSPHNVLHVIIDGEIVLFNGFLTRVNEREIYKRVEKAYFDLLSN